MNALSTNPTIAALAGRPTSQAAVPNANATEEAFQNFVGETFFGMMLKALRSTSQEVAYLDGGQAEDMFRQQLDQTVAEELSESHGRVLAEPLFRQFQGRLDVEV